MGKWPIIRNPNDKIVQTNNRLLKIKQLNLKKREVIEKLHEIYKNTDINLIENKEEFKNLGKDLDNWKNNIDKLYVTNIFSKISAFLEISESNETFKNGPIVSENKNEFFGRLRHPAVALFKIKDTDLI
jgi:hypothetical protein